MAANLGGTWGPICVFALLRLLWDGVDPSFRNIKLLLGIKVRNIFIDDLVIWFFGPQRNFVGKNIDWLHVSCPTWLLIQALLFLIILSFQLLTLCIPFERIVIKVFWDSHCIFSASHFVWREPFLGVWERDILIVVLGCLWIYGFGGCERSWRHLLLKHWHWHYRASDHLWESFVWDCERVLLSKLF